MSAPAALPVELVRYIFELSVRHVMRTDPHWVAQSLAITSRAVYAWVAPILFDSLCIRRRKLNAFYNLTTTLTPSAFAHVRTFISDEHAETAISPSN